MQKFHHLLGYHAIVINFSLIFFLNALHFLYLLCQAKSNDKDNSIRVIFTKIIIKINIIKIYTKNTHFFTTKCDITRIFIKKSKPSSAYKLVYSFLIILLVTNLSGISFNAAKESSTALSHILLVLYLSILKKDTKNHVTYFLSFILMKNIIMYKKTSVNCFITHFMSLIAFRNKC